jgi:signal transduction histidine kinase
MAVSQLLQLRSRSPAELDPARLERGLGVIGEAAQRMATQIDELLDAARARMGRPLRLEFAPTDVVALMAELVDEYQRTTEQHTLRLEQTVGTLVSMMDVARLRRPLANLLANAIKYSPRGGEIVTTLARGGDESAAWFAIRVTDQGVGIPPEEVDWVFDGFYRAGNVVGQFADSGLGLTGLRRIVEQHGGTTAIAGRPGSGTTVTVRLPLLHSPIEVGP